MMTITFLWVIGELHPQIHLRNDIGWTGKLAIPFAVSSMDHRQPKVLFQDSPDVKNRNVAVEMCPKKRTPPSVINNIHMAGVLLKRMWSFDGKTRKKTPCCPIVP